MNQQSMLDEFSRVLVNDMFQVSAGETVVITVDEGSHMNIVQSVFKKVSESGGLPLIMHVPMARADSEAGMIDWPVEPVIGSLVNADIWIEMNSVVMLYSGIWEKVMDQNNSIRYLVIGNSSLHSLSRIFTGFSITGLGDLLKKVMEMAAQTNTVRIVSHNGTDVSYETDPEHTLDIDDGDYSKPIFGTAPGYVNIVPKVGSMRGRIVFDALQNTDIFEHKEKVEFIMTNGQITKINGGEGAEIMRDHIASFDDSNMYKISHHMIGLNPNVKTLVGEIVEDERIWGGSDFGFGHTSPIDMPPNGQPAKSHFDGIVAKTSLYFDDVLIIDHGEVCHPELVHLAHDALGLTV